MQEKTQHSQNGGYCERAEKVQQVVRDTKNEEHGHKPPIVTGSWLRPVLVAPVEGVHKSVEDVPAKGEEVEQLLEEGEWVEHEDKGRKQDKEGQGQDGQDGKRTVIFSKVYLSSVAQ